MPMGRKSGNRLVPRHIPGHLNEFPVKERPNPKDRMEHEPDHSAQGLPTLEQTTCGSLCPREECKVGNMHVSNSGANVLESGQSSPVLEESIRLCVSSDKPYKDMSKQIRTEDVEVILIGPCWPNQEWFPELLNLTIDFPLILPPS